jgi:mono/diheme cytochrome c family protein
MTGSRYGARLGATAVGVIGATILLIAVPAAQQPSLPDGRGKAEFQRVCSGCHAPEAVVDGRRRSRESWRQVVDDMVVRGAEGSDDDLKLVLDYLVEHFGPPPGSH